MPRLADLGAADLPRPMGRYRLVGVLGHGGMGRVYQAELRGPAGFCKDVAIKVVRGGDDEFARSFLDEARIGARLRHPNVVDVYDFGIHEGEPWLAMELVPGSSLSAWLRGGELTPAASLDVAAQIADALGGVARTVLDGRRIAVVHRDLKPSNVVITPYGLVKLLDFGLARPSGRDEDSKVRGTLSYMAPEQLLGEGMDPRTDQFALGLLLYEMLAGEPFFDRAGPRSALARLPHMAEELARPGRLEPAAVVPGVEPVLRRLLAPRRQDRFWDADQVAIALRRLRGDGPGLRELVAPAEVSTTVADVARDPAAPSTGRPRTNLADEAQGFFGRERERAALVDRLDAGVRLLTLLGPAGVGKTRLARRVAAARQGRFPGGVWFVDACEATDGLGLLAAAAAAADLPLADREPARALARALAASGPALLVLDNLEQALPAAADAVQELLAGDPRLTLLATSRRRLGLEGEEATVLEPLQGTAAVELFLALAGRGDPVADVEAATAIVHAVDRLPLAVELAAAQARSRGLPAIEAALADGLTLDGDDRVRAAIDGSWRLLSPAARSAFAALACFRGPFDDEAADAILGPGSRGILAALVDDSLVRRVGGRYRLYASLAAFADDRLGGDARERAEHAHAVHYVGRAADWSERVDSEDAAAALAALGSIRDQLLAVVDRFAGTDPELAARAALGLDAAWSALGPQARSVPMLGRLLPAVQSPSLRARVAFRRLRAMRRSGALDDVIEVGPAAIADADAAGEPAVAVAVRAEVVSVLRRRGEEDRAAALLAAMDARVADDAEARAIALSLRALHAWTFVGPEASEPIHRDALHRWEALGNPRRAALERNAIAVNATHRGDWATAEAEYRAALAIHRGLGNRYGAAGVAANLGLFALTRGQLDEAREFLGLAARSNRGFGDRRIEGAVLANLAVVDALQGNAELADRRFVQAERLFVGSATAALRGSGLLQRAAFLLGERRALEAEWVARRARSVLDQAPGDYEGALADAVLAAALAWRGAFGEAEELLSAAPAAGADDEPAAAVALGAAHVALARARWLQALRRDPGDGVAQAEGAWATFGGVASPDDAPISAPRRLLRHALGRLLGREPDPGDKPA